MKKKITAIALVVCLLAICIVGGTVAYFSDSETATNVFTMGKVDIELGEESTPVDNGSEYEDIHGATADPTNPDGLTFTGVMPGFSYSKVPTVTVEADSNDAWVFVTATIEKAYFESAVVGGKWITLLDPANPNCVFKYLDTSYSVVVNTSDNTAVISKGGDAVAKVTVTVDNTAGTVVFTYLVLDSMTVGDTFTPFEVVTIPSGLTEADLDTNNDGDRDVESINVDVAAYAIQADGIDDVYDAYVAYFAD